MDDGAISKSVSTYSTRDDHGSGRQGQQRAGSLRRDSGETLLLPVTISVIHVYNAAKEEAHAHDEQQVGENRADHRRLDNSILLVPERDNADLEGVSVIPQRSRKSQARTINSTALPNVAFRRPPRASPNLAEISSVANESTEARGIMARKLRMKTVTGSQPLEPATIPTGTKTRNTLT